MSQLFYDHLIEIEYIHSEIEQLNLSYQEKEETIQLIEETVHYHIVKRILDKLHPDHHSTFLEKLARTPHDHHIISFLKEHVADIEDHIKEAAKELKYDLLKIIRSHSR